MLTWRYQPHVSGQDMVLSEMGNVQGVVQSRKGKVVLAENQQQDGKLQDKVLPGVEVVQGVLQQGEGKLLLVQHRIQCREEGHSQAEKQDNTRVTSCATV